MQGHLKHTEIHSAKDALGQFNASVRSADWRRFSYFFGVPTLLALYGAINNLDSVQSSGFDYTLIFYVAHAYVPWWVTCLSTRILFILLARWRPAAPVLWVLGAILSCILLIPYLSWLGVTLNGSQAVTGQSITIVDFFVHVVRVVTVWLLVNFLFEHFIGLPRYRYAVMPAISEKRQPETSKMQVEHAVKDAPAPTLEIADIPEFLQKTGKIHSVTDLLSLSAEEHYIRVHTPSGDALVYKRFKDAVGELDAMNGIRIHRSHWVSPYAVRGVIQNGKRMSVRLKDGNELPVSRPYQALVKSLATTCHQSRAGDS